MKLMHVLPLLTYTSFQSVHLSYSDFHLHSMTIVGCSTYHYAYMCSILLATMLHFVNYQ